MTTLNMEKIDKVYKLLDEYEHYGTVDSTELIEVLAREEMVISKGEFEYVLENYCGG